MMELLLSKERKARVWLDGLPYAFHLSDRNQYIRTPQGVAVPAAHRHCAIELFIPLGGRFNYGLLGCSVDDSEKQPEAIVVDASTRRSEVFADSLIKNLEEVHWGLDEEFADSVLDGALNGVAEFGLPGRQIHFNVAAHGEVGSSPKIFSRLGRLLIALTVCEGENQEDLSSLFEACLSE